jgi:hypothetical protein
MTALITTRSMPTVAAIAALALASGAALPGESQPLGRSSVYATSATERTPLTNAVAVQRVGRSSVYAWDLRAAPREVYIASRSTDFEGNGRGSVYMWQILQWQGRAGAAYSDREDTGS